MVSGGIASSGWFSGWRWRSVIDDNNFTDMTMVVDFLDLAVAGKLAVTNGNGMQGLVGKLKAS